MEFPRLVAVETTNRCNAKCVFCPNNALARDKGAMDQALFEKIIDDCRAFPLEAIEPFIQGEPFSDPDILDRMRLIRARLPKTKLRLYTNGYAMSPKQIDAMAGLGIDHLYVSLNTLDPEKYRDVMGLPIERTLRNLDHLTTAGRAERVARRITFRMTRFGDTTLEEQDAFERYCRERRVRSMIVGLFNYKGDIHSDLPVPRYGCEHVSRLDVLASGRVTLCCMDQDGEYGWADLNETSVLDAYHHARAAFYRAMHRTGRRSEVEPCGSCNVFWTSFRGLGPVEAVRTAAQYGAYVARHRPSGRKAPHAEASDGLVRLRVAHRSHEGE